MLTIEAGCEDDLAAILEVERTAQSHPWTAAGFKGALAGREGERALLVCEYRRLGLLVERRILGYCVVRMAASELEIHNLAVAPTGRRRGLARRLLGWVLTRAARMGAAQALLEVRAGNPAARALYSRLGFREIGRRPGYYSQPVDDALVLALQLGPSGGGPGACDAATGLP